MTKRKPKWRTVDGMIINKEDKIFEWDVCSMCGVMMTCPMCGNGSCNGGRGEIDGKPCPVCPLTHQYETLLIKSGGLPTIKKVLASWTAKRRNNYKRAVAAGKAERRNSEAVWRAAQREEKKLKNPTTKLLGWMDSVGAKRVDLKKRGHFSKRK